MKAVGEAGLTAGTAPRAKIHRTSLGALALSASGMLRLALQFALLPILARMVGPSEYGLVSLAIPVIFFTNVLADGGMSLALGRRKDASPELESTVFWLSAAVGLGLAVICCLIAFPMGALLHQPRLPWILMGLTPVLVMNSLTAVSNGRIIRERRFAIFAIGDFSSTVVGATTALLAAAHGFGAWSLVLHQLALWTTKFAWVTWQGRAVIRFRFRFREAWPLLVFGFSTIGALISDFVSRNADNLIVGGVLGTTALGYYAMAYQLIRIPDMLIVGPLYMYIFTAVSRTVHDQSHEALRELTAAGVRLTATALAPLFCGLALVAEPAVRLVLGPEWLGVIEPLRFLTGAGFAFGMCIFFGNMVMGMGLSGLQLRMSLLLGGTTVITVAAAARFGLVAVSIGLAVMLSLVMAAYVDRLAKSLAIGRARLARSFLPAAAGCAAMAPVVLLARQELTGRLPLAAELAVLVALGGAVYLGVLALLFRAQLLRDARTFSRAHADEPTAEAEARGAERLETMTGAV